MTIFSRATGGSHSDSGPADQIASVLPEIESVLFIHFCLSFSLFSELAVVHQIGKMRRELTY